MMRILRYLLLLGCVLLTWGCGNEVSFTPVDGALPPVSPSFIDPTAELGEQVQLGRQVLIAPFARVQGPVTVGDRSNLQDNVIVEGQVAIGDQAILAHGCVVRGPATIGATGGAPCFIGFNALVEGGVVEPGAMVSILARLGPGVTLRQGMRILEGKNVTTQAEADEPALGKVTPVTDNDRHFMEDVLQVNFDLAAGYAAMEVEDANLVRGIGPSPVTSLHNVRHFPTLEGVPTSDPLFSNRIIGQTLLSDTLVELFQKLGRRVSIRSDEGSPFQIGRLGSMDSEVTLHALEHSSITVGENCQLGTRVVLHGGEDRANVPQSVTRLGNNVTVGAGAVVFRATVENGCTIGAGALVAGSQLAPGSDIPARTILIGNQNLGEVEW